ncbi:MAG: DMT family transporter [Bacteroidales bacterium]|jgi:drug/metabolite transporter (DMT)-like permease|nr:DMT family transporter [Bacteroidales bacterium]
MFQSHPGEFAALLTAIFWTITALAFESASKKVGSLSTNIIRLMLAFIFIGIYGLIVKGSFLPVGASAHNWIWLSLSGLVGFVLGDLFLFQAYVVVGARVSMLIMSLTPPITAFIGWIVMGEKLTMQNFIGMFLTLSGIILVLFNREPQVDEDNNKNGKKKVKLIYPILGILLAFGGALGQAGGLVLSKYGMVDYDPFAATQIRVITGVIGFAFIFLVTQSWTKLFSAVKNKKAMTRLSIGAFFGPFLGVSFSLLSVKYTTTGVASTIMSIVPILIIPPAVIFLKDKLTIREVIGAVIAVSGVILFFM